MRNNANNTDHDHIVWEWRCPECLTLYRTRNSRSPKSMRYRDRVQACPDCSTETEERF